MQRHFEECPSPEGGALSPAHLQLLFECKKATVCSCWVGHNTVLHAQLKEWQCNVPQVMWGTNPGDKRKGSALLSPGLPGREIDYRHVGSLDLGSIGLSSCN